MQRQARLGSRRRKGQITIEWILLATVLAIGIIGGLGVVRNAIVSEMKDIADAVVAFRFFP